MKTKIFFYAFLLLCVHSICFGQDMGGMNRNILHLLKTCKVQSSSNQQDEFLIFVNLKDLHENSTKFSASLNHKAQKYNATLGQWEIVRFGLIPNATIELDVANKALLPGEVHFDYWLAFGNLAVLKLNFGTNAPTNASFEVTARGKTISKPATCETTAYLK